MLHFKYLDSDKKEKLFFNFVKKSSLEDIN